MRKHVGSIGSDEAPVDSGRFISKELSGLDRPDSTKVGKQRRALIGTARTETSRCIAVEIEPLA